MNSVLVEVIVVLQQWGNSACPSHRMSADLSEVMRHSMWRFYLAFLLEERYSRQKKQVQRLWGSRDTGEIQWERAVATPAAGVCDLVSSLGCHISRGA